MRPTESQSQHGEGWPADEALDRLLELDRVETPEALVQTAREAARAELRAEPADARPHTLRPVPPAGGAGRRPRLLASLALAAAAAVALFAVRPWRTVAPDGEGEPSDELLAALPALEAFDFLTVELDPLEADALFLMDPADALVLGAVEEDL